MGKPEEMSVERFFEEPGETVSSSNAPKQQAPEAGGYSEHGDDPVEYQEEPAGPPTEPAGPLPEEETSEPGPQVDGAELHKANEQLRQQNVNLQRLVGDQGRQLGEIQRHNKLLEDIARGRITGGERQSLDDFESDEPLTRRDLEQFRTQLQRDQFLQETALRDNDFVAKMNLDPQTVEHIRQFNTARAILSVEDGYYAMVGQGIIRMPEPERRVPSVKGRAMPSQVSGKRRAASSSAGTEVDIEKLREVASANQIEDEIKRRFYPELK